MSATKADEIQRLREIGLGFPLTRSAFSMEVEVHAESLHTTTYRSTLANSGFLLTRHFAIAFEQAGEGFAMLRGSDEPSLVLMAFGADGPRPNPRVDAFGLRVATHIGFVAATAEAVRAKHVELDEGGCRLDGIKTFEALGKGWTAFYCPLGVGLGIEATAHT